jgi:hypothetical protein
MTYGADPSTLTYVSSLAIDGLNGNVSIGDSAAAAMFNVGTANQFQVTSTGVSSAGAGSTDLNGSGVPEAHCLADGTGGGVCGGGVTPITGTVTLTPVTNTTSVSCASTTCTNVRGVLTIVQSGTNGEVNVSWPTTTTAQICSVASNDGSQLNGYYTDVATAIGVNIFFYTAGIGTIHPMYSCQK